MSLLRLMQFMHKRRDSKGTRESMFGLLPLMAMNLHCILGGGLDFVC